MTYSKPHLLSVNLEDYFQVAPLRQVIPQRHWLRFSLRIEQSTLATLDMLDKHGAKATFFALGWLAERRPDLIREVADRGHEVASKGYHHSSFEHLTLDGFRDDLLRSRDAIENATGRAVLGYRIAEGQLPITDLAPFRVLAEAGMRYDSSIRPFGFGFAGHPEWRKQRTISGENWSIEEVPLSSSTVLGVPVPVTGGNYHRQLPAALYRQRLAAHLRQSDAPWHFYFHTWEMDPEQPRISAISYFKRMRQYRNLEEMRDRIEETVSRHKFHSIAEHLNLVAQPVAPHEKIAERPIVVSGNAVARTKVTVVIPCYNEEDTLSYLRGTLASFRDKNPQLDLSFVFVDDGSKDATWKVLNELFGGDPTCTLVQHPKNRGIAAATMTGIAAAKDEIVCGIDCDCSFDPHTLADMIPLLTDDVDMVQASPYHPKGGVVNVPAWRLALSRNLSRIYRRVLNHKFASYTACFRVYRRSRIKDIRLDDEGFLGIAEMFIRLDQTGAHIVEFPTVLESRLIGVSKMKTVRVIRAHLNMLKRLITGTMDSEQATTPAAKQV